MLFLFWWVDSQKQLANLMLKAVRAFLRLLAKDYSFLISSIAMVVERQ